MYMTDVVWVRIEDKRLVYAEFVDHYDVSSVLDAVTWLLKGHGVELDISRNRLALLCDALAGMEVDVSEYANRQRVAA